MKFSVLFLSLFLVNVWAAPLSMDAILEREQRPTMAEILPHVEKANWPGIPVTAETAAQYFDQRIEVERWLGVLEESGPRLIAAMEKSFPGATWGFMGRDAMAIADMVEAFYIEIGQPERVQRLGVSKASFVNTAHETYMDFLRTHDLTPEAIEKYPYIFIDPVSGGFGRQGRTLLSAFYQQWAMDGKDPKFLVGRVNMLGLIVSTFKSQPNDFSSPGEFVIKSFNAIDKNPNRDAATFFNNHKIMTYPLQPNAANEAGYTHFIGAWHESYGAMETNSRTGETLATRGAVFPLEMRQTVLWTQAQIAKKVMTPEFVERVQEEARKLGYEFPMQRLSTSSVYAKRVRQAINASQNFAKINIDTSKIPIMSSETKTAFNLLYSEGFATVEEAVEKGAERSVEFAKNKQYKGAERTWMGLNFFWTVTQYYARQGGVQISARTMDHLFTVIASGQWSSEAYDLFNHIRSRYPNFDEMLEQRRPQKPAKSLKLYFEYRETAQQCMDLLK